LSPEQLLPLGGGRGRKKIRIRNGDGTEVVGLAGQFLGGLGFGIVEFDNDEIDLELLLRLPADKKRRTPPSGNDLYWIRWSQEFKGISLTWLGKWVLLKTNAKLP